MCDVWNTNQYKSNGVLIGTCFFATYLYSSWLSIWEASPRWTSQNTAWKKLVVSTHLDNEFSPDRGENKKYLKRTTTQYVYIYI